MDRLCEPVDIDGVQYFFYASMDDDRHSLQLAAVNDEREYHETFTLTYESSRIEKRFDPQDATHIVLPIIIAQRIDALRKMTAGELVPPLEEIARAERQV